MTDNELRIALAITFKLFDGVGCLKDFIVLCENDFDVSKLEEVMVLLESFGIELQKKVGVRHEDTGNL